MAYFYVKTCYEKENGHRKKDKKVRVRILGGQKLNGKDLDVTLNISCSHSIREEHPIGSIFCCTEIMSRESPKKVPFYKVNDNKLYLMESEGVINPNPESSFKLSKMLEDYQKQLPYMINEERRLKLNWILSDDDCPLI